MANMMAVAEEETNKPGGNEQPASELTPEGREIADRLDRELPADSEARDMFQDILQGRRLGPHDGWFRKAVAQTRFPWTAVCAEYDTNRDGVVTPAEFSGSEADFARLDHNGNGNLDEQDLSWGDHALNRTPGAMLFYRADADGNGKLTRMEFEQLFAQLAGTSGDFVSLDEMRAAVDTPTMVPQRPRRDQPVAIINYRAIDFTLKSVDGRRDVTLSDHIGTKPLVLVFGNFTCGPFRSQAGNVEKLYQRYNDRVEFLMVYVREAHPTDGWWMESNNRLGIEIAQPQTADERSAVARRCVSHLQLSFPVLVDGLDDRVGAQYSGMPSRLYVIDREGRIAYKSGRGPFGFKPAECEQSLVFLLNHPTTIPRPGAGSR